MPDWVKVVFAADLKECDCCDEIWCDTCKKHYADCSCVGPTMDGYEYEERDGVMYARKLAEEKKFLFTYKYDIVFEDETFETNEVTVFADKERESQ